MRSSCQASWPPPTITLDRKWTRKWRRNVWSVDRFGLSFPFFSFSWRVCTGVWEWMCEWMSLQCHSCQWADSGPWRKMSWAWPRISMKTTPGSTCPSHQESPGELLKPGRKRLLMRLLETDYCWAMLRYLLNTSGNVFCQYCEKASDVWAVLRSICEAFWPSPTTTLDRKRTTKRRRHVWWVESFGLCFRSVHGWIGMKVWVNIFPKLFLCIDRGGRCLAPDRQCPQ